MPKRKWSIFSAVGHPCYSPVAVMAASTSTTSGERVVRMREFGVKTKQSILYLTSGTYTYRSVRESEYFFIIILV